VIYRLQDAAASFLNHRAAGFAEVEANEYPYFNFIPSVEGAAIPGGATASWEGLCFQNSTASAAVNPANSSQIILTFQLSQPKSLLCSDFYLLGTVSGLQLKSFFLHGTHTVVFSLPSGATEAEVWDIMNKGVRIFQFQGGAVQTVSDLLSTLLLFGSEATQGVPQWVSDVNLDFLAKYAGVNMTPRATPSVTIDEDSVQSGDFFGIIRLDGLDPVLAWAMGSTTGHTTVALRDADGELYIAESTVKDSYWPTDGIQKTPFKQWILQARAAGYQVVHAPLDKEIAASFNTTAAWNLFNQLEGVEYGYRNMLWGWVDTLKDNYPCLPPDYTRCLQWEHLEVLFGVADHLLPFFTNLMITPAWNLRLNTTGLNVSEILYYAAQQGIDPQSIPTMVELDSYDYQTTRYNDSVVSKSMVCCVFVCNMWKAGGVFDGIGRDLNCAELTNWDDYSLKIFDSVTARPPQCVAADPNNALCQLEGEYTLVLNNYNSKAPYAHIAERCPSEAPNYNKPANC